MKSAKHLMRSPLGLVMFLCLAVALTACAPAGEPPGPAQQVTTAADVAAINGVGDEYFAALNAGDVAGFVALLTEDAVIMPPNQPANIGQEAIRAGMQTLFDQNTLELTRTSEEVVVAGDWAFARWTATGTSTPKAGGEPVEVSNKSIFILQRQPDGSWKVARAIINSNNPR